MANFSQPYYPHQEQAQVLFVSNGHGDGQYEMRSKTPTSLVNHTGLSPCPLSTPPRSRNASQQPEQPLEQPPEQMLWENEQGSSSDSATSVRTPDDTTFEVDMLDSESLRNFYQNQNSGMMTSQTSQGALHSMDASAYIAQDALNDQVLQDALHTTMTQPQFQQQFGIQTQSAQSAPSSQPYNQFYGQNYTSQPPREDPWNGNGPFRYSSIPRSGNVIFDPITDPMNYTGYVNDVDSWTLNNTDPNYLVSPNDPMMPPQDTIFPLAAHNLMHPHSSNQIRQTPIQDHSPVGMRVVGASSPPDSQGFVHYDASSPSFAENYVADSRLSYRTPAVQLSAQQAHSPFQSANSPQGSAPSPISEGMVSYQHSDSGMPPVSHPSGKLDNNIQHASPEELQRSPARSLPETICDASPEPEPARPKTGRASGRPGGRATGTHLEPKVAKAAHDMRKIVACWHCVLQRDKCGPGEICDRCLKRSQRPNADCGLGCIRVKLTDLAQVFLPSIVTHMHDDNYLSQFVSNYVHSWNNIEITLMMTCGQAEMPRIPVKVYEFLPRGNELLVQYQYMTDPVTHKRVQLRKQSPALGMVHINKYEERKYDKYISDIVDYHIDAFGDLCWKDDDNDFQQKLFRLMTRVKPNSDDEAKLLREIFRLIVATFIMSHTLTIAEETKVQSLSKMHSYQGPASYVSNFTSPRMANRQLKFYFNRLQRSILETVLNKLQQMIKSSKGCDKWILAFVGVLGMCMAHEDEQKTIHVVMQTRATPANGLASPEALAKANIEAEMTCREIDRQMGFISHLFRLKYNRKFNPLRDADHDWDKEVGFGDASSVSFVRQVAQLVRENIGFLQARQNVSISAANQTKYTSRLVGQFLLAFWLP